MKDDLTRRVAEVLADTLGVEVAEISETTTLDDLHADSLDQVELELALEDEFEIGDGVGKLTGAATLASISAMVAGALNGGAQ